MFELFSKISERAGIFGAMTGVSRFSWFLWNRRCRSREQIRRSLVAYAALVALSTAAQFTAAQVQEHREEELELVAAGGIRAQQFQFGRLLPAANRSVSAEVSCCMDALGPESDTASKLAGKLDVIVSSQAKLRDCVSRVGNESDRGRIRRAESALRDIVEATRSACGLLWHQLTGEPPSDAPVFWHNVP